MTSVCSTVVTTEVQVSSDLGGETAILDLKVGVYCGPDEVGSRIWELVQEPRKVTDIRDTLVSEYAAESDRCERDLFTLL